MAPTETRQWIVDKKPVGAVQLSGPDATFKLVTVPLPALEEGQVLIKVLHLSNDPAQRGWISANTKPERLYTKPVDQGAPMRSFSISQVVESKAENLPVGTFVSAQAVWAEYAVVPATQCRAVQPIGDLSLTHYIGSFGGPGMTAWYGAKEIVRSGPDDVLVVSGAAGATGNMVVQIAKNILGCKKVIGIAGSDEKCRWVESLGADICLNYKKESFEQDLIAATPDFVDVYFDNVGGEILDLMIGRMKRNGRIAACGAVSQYNTDTPHPITKWTDVVTMRLEIRGFIVTDAIEAGKGPEFMGGLIKGYKEGKLKISDDSQTVVPTKFEDIPKTWLMLFDGGNRGKLITSIV